MKVLNKSLIGAAVLLCSSSVFAPISIYSPVKRRSSPILLASVLMLLIHQILLLRKIQNYAIGHLF